MGCGSSIAASGTSDTGKGGAIAPQVVSQSGNVDPAIAGMPNGKPPMITAPSTPTHVNLHVITGATPTAATPHVPQTLPPPVVGVPIHPTTAAATTTTAVSSSSGTNGPATGNLRAAAAANAAAGLSARSRVPAPPAPVMDASSRTIVLFTINDVYLVDHLPKIRTHILRRLAAKRYKQAFITLPGDFLGPSPLSAFDNGSHMIDALCMLGLNRACLGNHEFDFGQKILEQQMTRLMDAGCLLLNSNITGGLPGSIPHHIDEIAMPSGLKAPNGSDTFRLGWFGTCTTDTEAMAGKDKMGTMVFSPHMEANTKMTASLKQEHKCDFVIGMTHQWAETEDRPMMKDTPLLDLGIGGHDHIPALYRYDEAGVEHTHVNPNEFTDDGARNRWMVKVGENATHIGIIEIDLVTGRTTRVEMNDVRMDEPEPQLNALVDRVNEQIQALQGFQFFAPPNVEKGEIPLSSEKPRERQCTVGRLFSTLLRNVNDADLCLWHGGNIRAGKTYLNGFFMADLLNELPFPANPIKVSIRGGDIPAIIQFSHTWHYPGYGCYFQFDDGVEWDEKNATFIKIGEEPFNPEQIYQVVLDVKLLTGMDNVAPLMDLQRAGKIGGSAPRHLKWAMEAGHTQREQILSALVEDQWDRVFGGKTWTELDQDQDGVLSPAEIEHGIANQQLIAVVLKLADRGHTGKITQGDFEKESSKHHRVSFAGLETPTGAAAAAARDAHIAANGGHATPPSSTGITPSASNNNIAAMATAAATGTTPVAAPTIAPATAAGTTPVAHYPE